MNNTRDPKTNAAAPPTPAEARINLTIERIRVTGLELSPLETERFEALLVDELKRQLIERFTVMDDDVSAEALRFDLSEIALNIDQTGASASASAGDAARAAHDIARRLALTLESAAKKGTV